MKILHLDDHNLFSEGLASILVTHDIEVICMDNTKSAIALLDQHQNFDLIITDLSLPGLDGFAFIQSVFQRELLLPVAVLSATEDLWLINKALTAGVAGFIPKTYNTKKIVQAIHIMLQGEVYLPTHLKKSIARLPTTEPNDALSKKLSTYQLTVRQLDVLKLMKKGHSNDEIATILFVSRNTIKTHAKNLFSAFKVNNRMECVRFAEDINLI